METRANHIWVGVVTLFLLAGLAALTIWIARLGQRDQMEYDIFFKQSVEGVTKGSTITFSGVPAGLVEDIKLWEKDPEFVRVRIQIDKDIPILQGTTASLQGSFTGVTTILLDGAVKNAPAITEPGPDGVPVIPTKRGGLGALLSSAPLLIERLASLSERLSLVLSDKNQKSFENILANSDKLTGSLAIAAPQVKQTLAELQLAIKQATVTLASIDKLSNSANALVGDEGNGLAKEFRVTLKAAQSAAKSLQDTFDQAQPTVRQINERSLPALEATLRDVEATSRSLRAVTEQINDRGITSVVGSGKLPDYKP